MTAAPPGPRSGRLQFRKGKRIFRYAGVLTLPLECEETEEFVLGDRATDGSAEELAAVRTLLSRWLLLIEVLRIELLFPEETKRRPVIVVRAELRNQVDGGAFRTPVGGREALRADHEFLNSLERKLHHRTADGVVFVVDAIDGYVDVAPALPIHREDCITVLGRVIRIHQWRRQQRQHRRRSGD